MRSLILNKTARLDVARLGWATAALAVVASCGTEVVDPPDINGALRIELVGLPGNATVVVRVTGPGGVEQTVSGTATLPGLTPGTYTILAGVAEANGDRYDPTPGTANVEILAGSVPTVAFTYALASGRLAVGISGLPAGAAGAVTVTGSNQFAQTVSASTTLIALAPGTYTVTADPVTFAGTTFTGPVPFDVDVAAVPEPAAANVVYGFGGTFNLSIPAAYFVQVVQRTDGTVPLIAGRAALLRVFVQANESNTSAPTVRVRLYDDGVLFETLTIAAPTASVPQSIDESNLSASWNVSVPAASMRANLSVLIDVDPDGLEFEIDKGDNTFPNGGAPQPADVRTPPPVEVRLVPVRNGTFVGDVTAANLGGFLALAQKLFPTAVIDADIRNIFTAPVDELTNSDSIAIMMQQIRSLRGADLSDRIYVGVVHPSAWPGGGDRYVSDLGGTAALVRVESAPGFLFAHAVGHSFGVRHPPACDPAGDAGFPYPGDAIGRWGYDLTTGALVPPTTPDLMSNCANVEWWLSDYVYELMLADLLIP